MKKILCFAALIGFINHASAQNTFPIAAGTNVGIGTGTPTTGRLVVNTGVAAPASALDIRNSAGGADNNPAITWSGGAYGFIDFNLNSTQGVRYSALGPLVFGSNTNAVYGSSTFAEAMRITAAGKVGIGMNAPGAQLHINSINTTTNTRGNVFISTSDAAAIDLGGQLSFGGSYTGTTQTYWAGIAGRKENVTDSDYAGYLQFSTRKNAGNSLERMRVTSDGNLGIGTPSPGLKTHINGITGFPATTGTAQMGVLRLQGLSSNAVLDFGVNGVSGAYLQSTNQTALNANYPLLLNPNGGGVSIGTTDMPAGHRLAVNGSVIATSVTVKVKNDWPDYVFKKAYKLPTLTEVKDYIDQNHHLPDMPSEKEVITNGLNLGEMNKILTKKVEELTLYLIEQDTEKKRQSITIGLQESRLKQQQADIEELKSEMKSLLKH
jgi:hypothetical protein